ncbi:MAG TPA: TlyA family RNA methyltransferase [Acidimicrobiia bacterium]|nr:TlyA family RNA methyltransferase [Acidimicrobiia bacterium]
MRRDLARSRAEAQQLISGSRVVVGGMPAPKPASLVAPDTPIELVSDERRWVSRGALKLLAALEAFPVDLDGKEVLDVGASTGGFTEVALDHGAVSVTAVDVGRGQLHESLLRDPRVDSRERTNFRLADLDRLGAPFPVVVADLSFISLCTVADNLAAASAAGADLIVLVKPQFEAGKGQVGRGGVVRDRAVRERAVRQVIDCLGRVGLGALGLIRSPIEGRDGNIEYLLWLRKDAEGLELEVPA